MVKGYFFDGEANKITEYFPNERMAEEYAAARGLELWKTQEVSNAEFLKIMEEDGLPY